MVDVLLNTDDIVVFGPPDTVELQLDIGAQGTRGSKFFVGAGDPNAQTSGGVLGGQTLQLNDLYLNASPGGTYGYIFQYVSEPGGNTWVQVLNINPAIYSINYATTFEDGEAQIVIPIEDIVTISGTPLTAENFNVKYSIAHDNPIASSMQIPSIVGSDLIINLNAVEYESSSWLPLGDTGTYPSGVQVTTHLQITIVS